MARKDNEPNASPQTTFRSSQDSVALADFKLSSPEDDEACNQLWAAGFPPPAPGQPPLICVLYKTFHVLES